MELSKKVVGILGTNPEVKPERFIEELWSLRPHGNDEDTYINTVYAIRTEKDFFGNPVTFETIVKKYKEYLAQCAFEERPAQFIKSIKSFIRDHGWNETYQGPDNDLKRRYL